MTPYFQYLDQLFPPKTGIFAALLMNIFLGWLLTIIEPGPLEGRHSRSGILLLSLAPCILSFGQIAVLYDAMNTPGSAPWAFNAWTFLPTAALGLSVTILAYALVFKVCGLRRTAAEAEELSTVDYIYFSVVTITTVGYGDIVPASRAARIIAAIEAISGYFLLAVLAAGLAKFLVVQSP